MTFNTSLDRLAKRVTIGITILFATIIIGQYIAFNDGDKTIHNYITVGLLLIYFFAFAFRPINYTLTTEKLIVHRPLSNVKINRTEIKSVEQIDKEKLEQTFRTFGVGGLFGYFGKFANTKLGSMMWYATRRDNAVLITTIDNKKIVLTPDNPEEFVANFNLYPMPAGSRS